MSEKPVIFLCTLSYDNDGVFFMKKNSAKLAMIVCSTLVIAAVVLSVLVPLIMKAATVAAPGKLYPIYRVDTAEKKVAFGINCAWEDTDTDAFLKILKEKNVRATFFVVGEFAARCENAVVRIHAAGHEIGNHSDTHPDMAKLSADAMKKEIESAGRKIEKITGEKPSLFRAPSGSYTSELVKTAQDLGYHCVQWDADTVDWKGLSATDMTDRVMKNLQNGSIVLLHLGAAHTLEALPQLIDRIREAGYEIVPVSELIYTENYYVDRQGVQHSRITD